MKPLDIIDEELMRLRNRLDDLKLRVIPGFESKTQALFAQIMRMPKDSEKREKLEAEFKVLSNDLSRRSDELIKIRQEMENLEAEQKFSRR